MPVKDWTDLMERFEELGGAAQNICQREGEFGRGIFPINPYHMSRIITPKNLLLHSDNVGLSDGELFIKDTSSYSAQEKEFIEYYYNSFSWGCDGNRDSIEYLNFISTLNEASSSALISNGFLAKNFQHGYPRGDNLLKRFIDERAVGFDGNKVLAPVWEFVNHSSFALPLRVTSIGVETPPFDLGGGEILFKYGGYNSPMSMWRKYGFACQCIVAYSIPFSINLSNESQGIECSGQQGLTPKEGKGLVFKNRSILIKSLPVGCLSNSLPFTTFNSFLSSAGFAIERTKELFTKVQELNINARRELLSSLHAPGIVTQSSLHKALTYEIELIQNCFYG